MTFMMICAYIGIAIWVIGILNVIAVIRSKDKAFGTGGDKEFACAILLCVCGFVGMLFTAGATSTAVKDVKVSYEVPTAIIKTNDITLVSHIKDGVLVCNVSSSEISFWNSSNIMVRVINGKNMWNTVMNSRYNVVLRGE